MEEWTELRREVVAPAMEHNADLRGAIVHLHELVAERAVDDWAKPLVTIAALLIDVCMAQNRGLDVLVTRIEALELAGP